MNNEITLNQTEILMAAHAGLMRHAMNIESNKAETYGASQYTDWQLHIEGALGEYALAKYLNVHWLGTGSMLLPDVGDVDARTTMRPGNRLCLHAADKDSRQYWLVTGVNGNYVIRGWLYAREGKKAEYWSDPTEKNRWAFWVPQKYLHRPDERAGGATLTSDILSAI